jgi:hypothetical protein
MHDPTAMAGASEWQPTCLSILLPWHQTSHSAHMKCLCSPAAAARSKSYGSLCCASCGATKASPASIMRGLDAAAASCGRKHAEKRDWKDKNEESNAW